MQAYVNIFSVPIVSIFFRNFQSNQPRSVTTFNQFTNYFNCVQTTQLESEVGFSWFLIGKQYHHVDIVVKN